MNPKLIIASLAGVSVLGGGMVGSYYYFNSKKTIDNTNSETGTTETLENTAPKQENSVQSEPNSATTSPQTKGQDKISSAPQSNQGKAETGAPDSGGESGSKPTTTVGAQNPSGSVSQSPSGDQVSRT